MRIPEFVISGVSRTTGHLQTLRVRAADEKAAEAQAVQRGLNVLTVEPAPSSGGAEPPPMQTVAALDDPSNSDVMRSGFSTPVLGVFILMGLALIVFTGGSLPARTKAYLAERDAAAAPKPVVDVKVKPEAKGVKTPGTKPGELVRVREEPTVPAVVIQGAGGEKVNLLPGLAVHYGLYLGGALFLLIPAVSLGRRMFGSSAE
jgi:hypothetical protein